ncbi:Rad52/Rad22 family DNA repair protein [Gemmata sp. JC717]|uniref:Rad52/Rad22 family DNA repair protein n=1 Tax=Gemmata algarum TaxID=2975278 RepID=UPI0021BB20E5|nr:Rad52/Rad22 family DNA repair protein [Gemmata algarum]MDY3551574.1 Rad52/Rad22 family DNA repair protein [Gemmata algarum]
MSTEATMTRDPRVVALTAALADPFEPRDVKFKPQMVKNNRCLAMAYVDARLIQDRLDDVLGVEHWEDVYEILPDGSVMCKLRCKIGDNWITKTDVGSPSEQPDLGDRLKAAFSDALKRAAVKFGIGRYLYRLSAAWVDYDPVKKQIVQPPPLPAWALPKAKSLSAKGTPTGVAAPAPKKEVQKSDAPPKPSIDTVSHHAATPKVEPVTTDVAKTEAAKGDAAKPTNLPTNGQELHRRLREYDAKLASQKLCPVGALLAHVTQAGVKAGYTANMVEWTGPAIQFAVDVVREFDQNARQGKPEPRTAA